MVRWTNAWLGEWSSITQWNGCPALALTWFYTSHYMINITLSLLLDDGYRLHDTSSTTSLKPYMLASLLVHTTEPAQLHLSRYSSCTLEYRPASYWIISWATWFMVLLLSSNSNLSVQMFPNIFKDSLFIFHCDSSDTTQLSEWILLCLIFLPTGLSFSISDPQSPAICLYSYFWLVWIHWIVNSMCWWH